MKRLEDRIKAIREEILKMHDLSRRSVELSFDALRGDRSVVWELSRIERETDVLDTDINYACTTFIALFQPVAKDLRFAISMMRISSSYERIADLAQEIGIYESKMPDKIFSAENVLIEMFDLIRRGFENTEGLREKITELDNVVDSVYVEVMEELENNCDINSVLIARHIERIGDLLAKIAARLIFVEEGRRVWIL